MYRKLEPNQVRDLFRLYNETVENALKYPGLVKLVEKYFSKKNPAYVLVSFSNEYDDEWYHPKIQSVSVFGKDEVEIGLTLAEKKKFVVDVENMQLAKYQEEEPKEDIVIRLTDKFPDVYVKE